MNEFQWDALFRKIMTENGFSIASPVAKIKISSVVSDGLKTPGLAQDMLLIMNEVIGDD